MSDDEITERVFLEMYESGLGWSWMKLHRKRRVTKRRVRRWLNMCRKLSRRARTDHFVYATLAAFPEMPVPRNARRT